MCLATGRRGKTKHACLHLDYAAARAAAMTPPEEGMSWLRAWMPCLRLASQMWQTGKGWEWERVQRAPCCTAREGWGRMPPCSARVSGGSCPCPQTGSGPCRLPACSAAAPHDKHISLLLQQCSCGQAAHVIEAAPHSPFKMLVSWQVQSSPGLSSVWEPANRV